MKRERTCLSISRVRYHDRFNSQIREQSWPLLMSVASIMSTDAQLDFTFVRTTSSIERRVSAQAMLCPCSQVVYSNTKIYVARVIEASTEIFDAFLSPFFGELKSKRFMG